METKKGIDVAFDFTSDTPHYWEGFWERNEGLGAGAYDPDSYSKTLQKYHQILWSKQLPNGEVMQLGVGNGASYLTWKGFRFGSDSIIASFRYKKYRDMIEQLEKSVDNYKEFMEDFLHRAYTIGGMIIFPKRVNGINQSRGTNMYIRDRWDLTLECIRRYYLGIESPLFDTLTQDKAFFDLFVDFKGYVDFFYLQDYVTPDYKAVNFWIGDGLGEYNPLPHSVEEYHQWIRKSLEFIEKRNARIAADI